MADQQVLGLDVPVDDVLRMAVAQGVRYLLYVLRSAALTGKHNVAVNRQNRTPLKLIKIINKLYYRYYFISSMES